MNEPKMIWGTIAPNGKIIAGTGFKVVKEAPAQGMYTIIFHGSFTTLPSVSATQIYPNQPDKDPVGGSTLDNAVLVYVLNDRFRVKTGQAAGNPEDRWFSFIVIGDEYSPTSVE